ncbi:MAG: 2,3-bisphosphoglycerate-independent phosphoglycerate mutase, partial [Chitinophagales bacterium]|nr:2,3-bisphosphoglycerate-independent phosphoglycerate mutase [Chitinophagales bacterium]
NANTPFIKSLYGKYPYCELKTSGEYVGLPDGQMGNSEVGHLNIGAGRIVYQELLRINKSIDSGEFFRNTELLDALSYVKQNNKTLHLIGLVSDGGVHSHINHLKALCRAAREHGLVRDQIHIHAFTDGRDTDPKSGVGYIKELIDFLNTTQSGYLASVVGRYYAMDRDKRWERIKVAYDLLVHGKGEPTLDAINTIKQRYSINQTDEFLLPIKVEGGKSIATDDAVICFNFRTDRCRQITIALTQSAFPEYDMYPLRLHYTTMTNYDATFKNVFHIFDNDNLENTLGEVLSKHQKKQLRISETEKYPHVTFFFSGGREEAFENETRILIPSPKVATYDLKPEMSAPEVTEKVLESLSANEYDFICLNYANADMVGHSGVYTAVIKACETVDACVEKVITNALKNDYTIILTADHGNADFMINEDGSPNTAHTTNPVPFFIIGDDVRKLRLKNGILADIAPTILEIMHIEKPPEMNGTSLIES